MRTRLSTFRYFHCQYYFFLFSSHFANGNKYFHKYKNRASEKLQCSLSAITNAIAVRNSLQLLKAINNNKKMNLVPVNSFVRTF